MRNRLIVSALVCLVLSMTGTARAADPIYGYRGPGGDCVGPEADPPVEFDVASGKNVKWAVQVPNWGHAEPLVVGDRVFVMSELGYVAGDDPVDFPVLSCHDADTGRLLWQREISTWDVMGPPGALAAAKKAWTEFHEKERIFFQLRHAWRTADEAEKEKLKPLLEKHHLQPGGKRGLEWKKGHRPLKNRKPFNDVGLYYEVWNWGRPWCIGYAYPTPVSDGERVYVVTGLYGFACYDLDGNLVWKRYHPGQASSNAGYGGNDYCKNARSPLLYRDLLISDAGNRIRAIDKNTGGILWEDEQYVKHASSVSPVVITVGGTDVLLTFNMHAYRLPDGKKLAVEGWGNHGTWMLVKRDEKDVVFFTGGGEHGGWKNKGKCENPPPAAVRFSLDGQTLRAEVLWAGIEGEQLNRHTGIVYYDGKLYHPRGLVLDAMTGKIVRGTPKKRHKTWFTPRTRQFLWIADGRLYGLDRVRRRGEPNYGRMQVFNLEGEKLSEIDIHPPKPEGQRAKQATGQFGQPNWGFAFGCPYTIAGDRIYIRTHGRLICSAREE